MALLFSMVFARNQWTFGARCALFEMSSEDLCRIIFACTPHLLIAAQPRFCYMSMSTSLSSHQHSSSSWCLQTGIKRVLTIDRTFSTAEHHNVAKMLDEYTQAKEDFDCRLANLVQTSKQNPPIQRCPRMRPERGYQFTAQDYCAIARFQLSEDEPLWPVIYWYQSYKKSMARIRVKLVACWPVFLSRKMSQSRISLHLSTFLGPAYRIQYSLSWCRKIWPPIPYICMHQEPEKLRLFAIDLYQSFACTAHIIELRKIELFWAVNSI